MISGVPEPLAASEAATGRGKSLLGPVAGSGKLGSGKLIGSGKQRTTAGTTAGTAVGTVGTAGTIAKKKKATSAANSKKWDSYSIYIQKVLKDTQPKYTITKSALNIMNSLALDAFERIATEASKLCTYSRKDTLSAREIDTAVSLVLTGDLANKAKADGATACAKYTAGPAEPRKNNAAQRPANRL